MNCSVEQREPASEEGQNGGTDGSNPVQTPGGGQNGKPDDQTYKKIVDLWGAKAVMELSAIVGYYTMVALTLNAHDIPLPDEVPLQLTVPGKGLFQVPAAADKKAGE